MEHNFKLMVCSLSGLIVLCSVSILVRHFNNVTDNWPKLLIKCLKTDNYNRLVETFIFNLFIDLCIIYVCIIFIIDIIYYLTNNFK